MSEPNDNKKAEKLDPKEEARKKLALQAKYSQRISIARSGRELFQQKDFVNAAKKYNEYLTILAHIQEVDSIHQIDPSKFDSKKDMTEMLLISHIYWELARVYEMTPKLQSSFEKCMRQFVRFTANQPYQVLNSEMLRKYIKRNKTTSVQILSLERAYSQIQVESKKCYIATFACGESHWITAELRAFKKSCLSGPTGVKLTSLYYQVSGPLVGWLSDKALLGQVVKASSLPILLSAATLVRATGLSKIPGKIKL